MVYILYITALHIVSFLVNLGLIDFFCRSPKRIFIHNSLWSQIIRIMLVSQTVLLSKLKFNMYIVESCSSCYINFGVSRRYSFLQYTKNVIHYGLHLKIFEDVLVLSNYSSLYKINVWYISFIIYGHHLKLCAYHL